MDKPILRKTRIPLPKQKLQTKKTIENPGSALHGEPGSNIRRIQFSTPILTVKKQKSYTRNFFEKKLHATTRTITKIAVIAGIGILSAFIPATIGHINKSKLALNTTAAASGDVVNVWWPVNNAVVSGSQPFKAMVPNQSIDQYTMYWQVDNGQLNKMDNNMQDYPHKEILVDLSGWKWKGVGPYILTFVAKDVNGQEIARQNVSITIPTGVAPSPVLSPAPVTQTVAPPTVTTVAVTPAPSTITQAAVVTQVVTTPSSSNPLRGAKLYINPYSDAKRQADAWRSWRPGDAAMMDKIAAGAESSWFGSWNSNVYQDVSNAVSTAVSQGAVPVLVAYNVPQRDCGGYSAGGTNSPDGYKSWIRSFADGIGDRPAAVILEPDALALITCLSSQDLQTRYMLIKDAVSVLKSKPRIAVYIDAGHPGWISASEMTSRLQKSGIDSADGFSLNVANFVTTQDNITYGQVISSNTNGKHFVIDTGRNGSGEAADHAWCNPSGRSLGVKPTTSTNNSLVDALLWVKGPSGSDGYCNGGPSAGTFWPEYGLGLAQRTNW